MKVKSILLAAAVAIISANSKKKQNSHLKSKQLLLRQLVVKPVTT